MDLGNPTLNHLLDTAAAEHAETEAIVTATERLTYGTFHDRVCEFARGLLSIGVRKGDRVGVLISNRTEWFVATYAIERVGATMVGLNTWYKADELRYALRQADVSTLVTLDSFLDNDYLGMLAEIDPAIERGDGRHVNSTALPVLQTVVVLGDAPSWAIAWGEVIDRSSQVSSERLEALVEEIQPSDEAFVLYSSGTTGRPKPIVLRHDGLATNPRSVGSRLGIEAGDRFWLGLPLFFSFAACNESITAFLHGATLVVQERFRAREAVEIVDEEDCTVLYGMGNMFKQMEDLEMDLQSSFESVRVALLVAPRPIRRRLEDDYGVDTVLTAYGLTEVCAICTATHHESPSEPRHRTMGLPLANVDIRIKDPETGAEVEPGKEGEICIRSRTMFSEYLKRPEETRESFDSDGYFRTGDVGWLDPDGRLVFEGRMKDLIKTGGINVSPREVQRVIDQHPAVDEAVVVGLPDEEKDEVVAAAVTLAGETDLTEAELISYCEDRMAAYKVPTVVAAWDDPFPRTDTGKVQRFKVRDSIAEGHSNPEP